MSTAARIDELRKKFEENPRRYFAPLANELRKAGDVAQSIALCREHLPKQPGHMSGYIVFGQALYEAGEFSEAHTVFHDALALDPENLIALRHLGDIARQSGDAADARRWYERVLESDPRNDDIAAHLASLRTPPAAQPAVSEEPSLVAPSSMTPALGAETIGFSGLPTPDSSMRSVNFDEISGRMNATPAGMPVVNTDLPLLDVDFGQPEAGDDPFAFVSRADAEAASGPQVPSATQANADALDFEDGLVAPEWPDTSDLVARVVTPRSVTPPVPSARVDEAAAFGRERVDPIDLSLADPERSGINAHAPEPDYPDSSSGNGSAEAESSQLETSQAETSDGTLPWISTLEESAVRESADDDGSVAALHEVGFAEEGERVDVAATVVTADHATGDADDIVRFTNTDADMQAQADAALDEIVDAFADDARANGEADVVHFEELERPVDEPAHEPEPEASAFVTETMGELLVAQGFLARATTVYVELVRRRPYDPVLTTRLSEIREMHMQAEAPAKSTMPAPSSSRPMVPTPRAAAAAVTPPEGLPAAPVERDVERDVAQFTARERFATLAARRVPRRTPPRASVAVDPVPEALSALFGAVHSADDDQAARAFADAFAPIEERTITEEDTLAFFGERDEAINEHPARASSPQTSAVVAANSPEFSFDRFFPDPARVVTRQDSEDSRAVSVAASEPVVDPDSTTSSNVAAAPAAAPAPAGDDLAQFAAWLKGLGNS